MHADDRVQQPHRERFCAHRDLFDADRHLCAVHRDVWQVQRDLWQVQRDVCDLSRSTRQANRNLALDAVRKLYHYTHTLERRTTVALLLWTSPST
jgi:hypothetical protein